MWLEACLFFYAGILAADFAGAPLNANRWKLILVILCALHARGRVRIAQWLTVICDALLLFTGFILPGMLLFCVVHGIYLFDILKIKKRQLPALGLAVLSFLILWRLGPVVAVGGAYAALLLQNCGWATVRAVREKTRASRLMAVGFWLFLGCDTCVTLFNTLYPVWSIGRWIWLFYGPSQILLSLSSTDT